MGYFDLPCPICGCNISGPFHIAVENQAVVHYLDERKPFLTWLDDLVVIRSTSREPYYGNYDQHGSVEGSGEVVDLVNSDQAVAVHVACWELAQKPDFSWFRTRKLNNDSASQYKAPFDSVVGQYLEWEDLILSRADYDVWEIIDPRVNDKSKERILGLIAALDDM